MSKDIFLKDHNGGVSTLEHATNEHAKRKNFNNNTFKCISKNPFSIKFIPDLGEGGATPNIIYIIIIL